MCQLSQNEMRWNNGESGSVWKAFVQKIWFLVLLLLTWFLIGCSSSLKSKTETKKSKKTNPNNVLDLLGKFPILLHFLFLSDKYGRMRFYFSLSKRALSLLPCQHFEIQIAFTSFKRAVKSTTVSVFCHIYKQIVCSNSFVTHLWIIHLDHSCNLHTFQLASNGIVDFYSHLQAQLRYYSPFFFLMTSSSKWLVNTKGCFISKKTFPKKNKQTLHKQISIKALG